MAYFDSSQINLTYLHADWQVDPKVNYITGAITYYFRTSQLTNKLYFLLAKNLRIDAVLYHQNSIAYSHDYLNKLQIFLPIAIEANQTDSITIRYQGVPSRSGFGAFTQSDHGYGPVIWTLSEPFGSMEWWPSKLSLDDKIDSIIDLLEDLRYEQSNKECENCQDDDDDDTNINDEDEENE